MGSEHPFGHSEDSIISNVSRAKRYGRMAETIKRGTSRYFEITCTRYHLQLNVCRSFTL